MHRQIEPRDIQPIAERVAALASHRQGTEAKPWFRLIEPDVVMSRLLSNPLVWIVNETYLVSIEVGSPWYTSKRLVEEQLVMKLYPDGPGSFADAVNFLKSAQQWVDAKGVGVGTALTLDDAALAAKYEAHGFVQVATTLFYTGQPTEDPHGKPIRGQVREEGS